MDWIKIANPSMLKGGFDSALLDKKALTIFMAFDERNRFFQGDIYDGFQCEIHSI